MSVDTLKVYSPFAGRYALMRCPVPIESNVLVPLRYNPSAVSLVPSYSDLMFWYIDTGSVTSMLKSNLLAETLPSVSSASCLYEYHPRNSNAPL